MHIIIAPNAFKGSLSATDAARCIAEGLQKSDLPCTVTLFPIADGGDETASLLSKNWKAERIDARVHDPLGRRITTAFGWIAAEKKAVIGMSDASGLKLLKKYELNPLRAHTFGTGELIKAALDKGAKEIIIGVGGSATVDGGTGLLKALGVAFLDEEGNEISELPVGLERLKSINIAALDKRLNSCKIIVLCDVQNMLLGNEGAVRVFGSQKGANEQDMILLERCMQQWNHRTRQARKKNMAEIKYGGAAGGIAAGLAVYTKAKLVSGIEFFLDELHFDQALKEADLVITGEGRIDGQTLEGKGPFGVARRARKKGIPVLGMAGEISSKQGKGISLYFDDLISVNPPQAVLKEALRNTGKNLTHCAFELGNMLANDDF